MKILYQTIAINSQVTKRCEEDSVNDKQKGQEIVLEPIRTPHLKQVFCSGNPVLHELLGEDNNFKKSTITPNRRKKYLHMSDLMA